MHEPPHVPNYGRPGKGPRLGAGHRPRRSSRWLTLGEPADARSSDDDWTVVTADGSRAAHWEHTVAVTADGPWVLTALDGGAALAALRRAVGVAD